MSRLRRLIIDELWALLEPLVVAAAAGVLGRGAQGIDTVARVQARAKRARGLAAPRDTGDWLPAPALAELSPPIRCNVAQRLAMALTRAAAAAEGRLTWAEQDLDVKMRLGQASGIAGGFFVTALAPRLGDLAERLATSDAAVLDVGTGVGEIAAAVAEAAPGVRVVGIDVLDDVLDVARAAVADRGLTDRVTFRHQDVATLSDVAAYDLVYLPAFFLPEDTLTTALPRIRRALRPGGWLVVVGHEPPREPLGRAVDTWRQTAAGCCTWDAGETGRRLVSAGFAQVQILQGNPFFPTRSWAPSSGERVMAGGPRCPRIGLTWRETDGRRPHLPGGPSVIASRCRPGSTHSAVTTRPPGPGSAAGPVVPRRTPGSPSDPGRPGREDPEQRPLGVAAPGAARCGDSCRGRRGRRADQIDDEDRQSSRGRGDPCWPTYRSSTV